MGFFWTIVVLVALLAVAWRFLGSYMAAVYEGRVHWLHRLERPIYKVLGTDPEHEQTSCNQSTDHGHASQAVMKPAPRRQHAGSCPP